MFAKEILNRKNEGGRDEPRRWRNDYSIVNETKGLLSNFSMIIVLVLLYY